MSHLPPVQVQAPSPFGAQLRRWRRRRRLTQAGLGERARVSTRHLSCLENGRAMPSRVLVQRLVDQLSLPGDERDALFLAAGFAPMESAHLVGGTGGFGSELAVRR